MSSVAFFDENMTTQLELDILWSALRIISWLDKRQKKKKKKNLKECSLIKERIDHQSDLFPL